MPTPCCCTGPVGELNCPELANPCFATNAEAFDFFDGGNADPSPYVTALGACTIKPLLLGRCVVWECKVAAGQSGGVRVVQPVTSAAGGLFSVGANQLCSLGWPDWPPIDSLRMDRGTMTIGGAEFRWQRNNYNDTNPDPQITQNYYDVLTQCRGETMWHGHGACGDWGSACREFGIYGSDPRNLWESRQFSMARGISVKACTEHGITTFTGPEAINFEEVTKRIWWDGGVANVAQVNFFEVDCDITFDVSLVDFYSVASGHTDECSSCDEDPLPCATLEIKDSSAKCHWPKEVDISWTYDYPDQWQTWEPNVDDNCDPPNPPPNIPTGICCGSFPIYTWCEPTPRGTLAYPCPGTTTGSEYQDCGSVQASPSEQQLDRCALSWCKDQDPSSTTGFDERQRVSVYVKLARGQCGTADEGWLFIHAQLYADMILGGGYTYRGWDAVMKVPHYDPWEILAITWPDSLFWNSGPCCWRHEPLGTCNGTADCDNPLSCCWKCSENCIGNQLGVYCSRLGSYYAKLRRMVIVPRCPDTSQN